MKISLVTGVWKRPEIFEMFAKGVHNLGVDLDVIVAGSEGDKSRNMVEAHGFHYIEIANKPLSKKMNATTLKAKELDSDYVICMGSDDIMSPELMQEYIKWMVLGYDYIGIIDLYFYDMVSKKAMYWGGYKERYRRYVPAGCCRVISKNLMNLWGWKPWNLGDDDFLDNSMEKKPKGKQKILSLKKLGMYALDIKSSTNMTPFQLWHNTAFIDPETIKHKFPYVIK